MMCKNAGSWFKKQFRGWSIMHGLFDAALVGGLGTIWAALSLSTWQIVSLVCAGTIAIISGTCLWLRRHEGHREARVGDKSGAKESVKKRLQTIASSMLEIRTHEEAEAVVRQAILYVTSCFNKSVGNELKAAADTIDRRTDWKEVLREIAVRLDAMSDIVYASDIKRMPPPGDR